MKHLIIAGARRCGTTSMYNYLAQHPLIFTAGPSPKQELHYFDNEANWSRGYEWYKSRFAGAADDAIALDKSPTYLQAPFVPERVAAQIPDAKIVIMLRDPGDRAFSDYAKRKSEGYESRSFLDALRDEISGYEAASPSDWWMSDRHLFGYIERSNYDLDRWYRFFPASSIIVFQLEFFRSHIDDVMNATFEFAGVDPIPVKDRRMWQGVSYAMDSRGPVMSDGARAIMSYWARVCGPRLSHMPISVGSVPWRLWV